MEGDDEDKKKTAKMVGVFITIPFVLALPPLIGWLIGNWLDHFFGIAPILSYALLFLGIIAGVREFFRIIHTFGSNGS